MSGADDTQERPQVLVVEHNPEIGSPIIEQLAADGYPADFARTAQHARTLARNRPPSLALLGDLEHPRATLELLMEIRDGNSNAPTPTAGIWRVDLPVIIVSSQAQEPDLLRAFDAGADDFLTRPARYLELRARIRALLSRAQGTRQERPIKVGPLAIDPRVHAVTLHERPVPMRRMEYEMLLHLASDPRRVFPKRDLLTAVWSYAAPGSTRTLDSHASRLRRKLATNNERWIVNVRGVGYSLL